MFASLVSYSQKPFGSLLVAYVMGITGLITVIAMLAATVAHQVITSFEPSLGGKSSAVSSRVETGLEIQARTASWKPDEHVVAPPHIIELALSASALAFGMDRAESAEGEFSAVKASGPPDPRSSGESVPEETIAAIQPRAPAIMPPMRQVSAIAGWRRRVMVRRVEADDESPARIIERSLRNLI